MKIRKQKYFNTIIPSCFHEKGFSILEVIASTGIITVCMLGIFSLIIYNYKIYHINKNKFIAIMLSQEGTELTRNLRDSNWLDEGRGWNEDLAAGSYKIEMDTDTETINIQSVGAGSPLTIGEGVRLKRYGHLYDHTNGTVDTPFYRKVEIEEIDENADETIDGLEVVSWVQWMESSKILEHKTIVFLYNWQ